MGDRADSGRARRIDAAAKATVVAGLRDGVGCDAAAAAAGFTSEAFGYARRRDPVFRLAWRWAIELAAIEAREAREAAALAAAVGDDAIEPNNLRLLQRRRRRGISFTDRRKQLFLDHFAATADVQASCRAAGVHYSTVYKHRRSDPVFAAGWDEALATAYALLEAEAVRQRLEAQQRAAFKPEPSGPSTGSGQAESAAEFERVVKLLTRLDRQGRRGVREIGAGRQQRMDFDEAIVLLDKKLRALGARHGVASAPIALPAPPTQEDEK